MNRYTPNKYLRINNEPRLNNYLCNVAFSIQELSKYKSPTLLFGDWFISNQFQCEMKLTLNRPGSGSHEGNWIKITLPVWWEFIPDINIMSHFVTGFLFLTMRPSGSAFLPTAVQHQLFTVHNWFKTSPTTGHLLTQRPTVTNPFMLILKVRIMIHFQM